MAQHAGTPEQQHGSTDVDREVARLYELYADRIFGYCLYRIGDRTEAEDAVQTTFLYAFRGLQRGVVPEVESAWLFTIAHNVCRSTRRGARRRGRVESQQDPQLLQELSPAVERDHDSLLGLEDALASIPENQRRAILLREWHGMPYREIAATLGLTQTAVEMLVFRARRSLADALDQGQKPTLRRRAARALSLGNLVSAAKSFFGGVSSAHVAAAAGAAVVATVVGGAASPSVHLHATARLMREAAPIAIASRVRARPRALVVPASKNSTRSAAPSHATAAAPAQTTETGAPSSASTAPPASRPVSQPSAHVAAPAVDVTSVVPAVTAPSLPDADLPPVQVDVDEATGAATSAVSEVTGVQLP